MKSEGHRAQRTSAPRPAVAAPQPLAKLFALVCGLWIGLSGIKFGNPIIFDQLIGTPKDLAEFIFTPWPIAWGYGVLLVAVMAAVPVLKPRFSKADWPIALLGLWFFCQLLSSGQTVDPRLSHPTVLHFGSCAVALLLGWWALAPLRSSPWFWTPVLIGFGYILYSGFDQHAGGLEATRKAFHENPNWQMYPREYLLKMESNRVFSTLVYPNAFAGLLLLFFPAAIWQAWHLTARWPRILRGVLVGLTGYLAVACFFWTGSKGGWLIALIAAGVYALHTPLPRRVKTALIVGGLVLGLGAFFIRFSGYFQKGATSVGARFVYWQAAVKIAQTHPMLGSGPGTFSVLFKQLKPPEAEMARLVHNDYLEQFSDSGWAGGLAFLAGMTGLLVASYRHRSRDPLDLLIWLGLLGWCLQAFIEFSLYIPGLAWPVFLFLGALYGPYQPGAARPAGAKSEG